MSNTQATGNADVSGNPASTAETNSSGTQDLQQFVATHAAEQGMTPEAFAEKYQSSLNKQEGENLVGRSFMQTRWLRNYTG